MKARLTQLLLALLALLAAPAYVSAHADLVSSTPADGATLTAVPATVTALFDEELEGDGSALTVVDAAGKRVDAGDGGVDLDDLDRKTMVVTLKSGLGAGTYTARWTAVSADDGDSTSGSFSFTVKPAAGAATATPGSGAPAATATVADPKALPPTGTPGPAQPAGQWLMLGALLLAAAGALLLRRVRA